jgi:hypothetical protein
VARRAWRQRGAVLVIAILGLGFAADPAPASARASGGGCNITNVVGVWNISVCISYRSSDQMLLPDYYINAIVPQYSGHGELYHEVVVRADGRYQVVSNVYTPSRGHNGPTMVRRESMGGSGSVRNRVELFASSNSGSPLATAYSPWLNFP